MEVATSASYKEPWDYPEQSIFSGMKICVDVSECKARGDAFDSIVIGYVHPSSPHTWRYDVEAMMLNHPKWGNEWQTEFIVSNINEVQRPIQKFIHISGHVTLPPHWDQVEELMDEVGDLSTRGADGFELISERLAHIRLEMDNVRSAATGFMGPELGWYIVMNTQPGKDDSERFQPTIMSEMLYYMFNTVKHLKDLGRSDLIQSFNNESFLQLHEEVALGITEADDIEDIPYSSLFQLMRSCAPKLSSEDVNGILASDVIQEHGSYEKAMSVMLKRYQKKVSVSSDESSMHPENVWMVAK